MNEKSYASEILKSEKNMEEFKENIQYHREVIEGLKTDYYDDIFEQKNNISRLKAKIVREKSYLKAVKESRRDARAKR